jgi:hypothetical protein
MELKNLVEIFRACPTPYKSFLGRGVRSAGLKGTTALGQNSLFLENISPS